MWDQEEGRRGKGKHLCCVVGDDGGGCQLLSSMVEVFDRVLRSETWSCVELELIGFQGSFQYRPASHG